MIILKMKRKKIHKIKTFNLYTKLLKSFFLIKFCVKKNYKLIKMEFFS